MTMPRAPQTAGGSEPVGTDLPLPDHVRGLDPRDRGGRRMECLDALHGARDPLDEAMVLFKKTIKVFQLQNDAI